MRIVSDDVRHFRILLPERNVRGIVHERFAHNIEIRIFVHHPFGPPCHSIFVVVRKRINANTVQIGIFRPPDGILHQIVFHKRIAVVHIRHGGIKPTVFVSESVCFRSIGIKLRCLAVIASFETFFSVFPLMNPVLRRQILNHPVVQTPVIRHKIHDEFHVSFVKFGRKPFKIFIGTETRINFIQICRSVSVIGIIFLVIQSKRCIPECRCAQFLDIVQMLNHAFDIAAMSATTELSVGFFGGIGSRIVVGIAVGKAVGHC